MNHPLGRVTLTAPTTVVPRAARAASEGLMSFETSNKIARRSNNFVLLIDGFLTRVLDCDSGTSINDRDPSR